MTELLVNHMEFAVSHAHFWGFLIVFILMSVESSFIPFPSEVIMIPAGFMAYRAELTFGIPGLDLSIVILCGIIGSLLGAYVNYYLAMKLGRPLLHRYGKYFLLSPPTIERAEEIFNEYGDITTFVCRLLPAIRQLISIPAGLSKMPFLRFTLFTALGAGIWSAILAAIGFYFGSLSENMTYREMVFKGKDFIHENLVWLVLGLAVIVFIYALVHHHIMKSSKKPKSLETQDNSSESTK